MAFQAPQLDSKENRELVDVLLTAAGILGTDDARDKLFTVTLPKNVTAQEGLCILIPCKFTIEETREAAESPRGYWFIEGDAMTAPVVASNGGKKEIREDTRGRFKLVGDVTQWDCSLRIDDVRKYDGRSYYFRYEHKEDTATKYSYVRYTYLLNVTVVDLQDTPAISLPDRVKEGETVTVECTAPGRCSGTAPKITWNFESQFKYNQSLDNIDNLNGTKIYKSTITFTASRQHNNKSLSCTSFFPAVQKQTTKSITLTVIYNETTELPLVPLIGGAVAGLLVLAGVCLLAWLMSNRVRRARNANNEAGDKKETVTDGLQIYSEVDMTKNGPRTENSPPSGANARDSKDEDMYANFRNDNIQYASIRFSRAKPESKPRPLPEESLYSEVKVG
ncbi:myeloid cell surface antigen CD33-like [Lissotriton helveticus]